MNLEDQLLTRAENKCELCTAKGDLSVYVVPGRKSAGADVSIMVCEICLAQLEKREAMDNHLYLRVDALLHSRLTLQTYCH
jgi:protein PhnA